MLRKLIDSPLFYFGLAGLLIVGAVFSQIRFEPPGRPAGHIEQIDELPDREHLNLVFIVVDMLRADRLRSYGHSRATSPVLDQIAATGIRFQNVEAQSSWTKASMASMWTGMYPERTGVQRFFHAMPEEAVLPAEIFKQAGYRTAGIWRNGWVANNFGFGQGFDLYIKPIQVRPEHRVTRHSPGIRGVPGTDMDATLSAIEFMTGERDNPFFLYIHYMDVHQYLYTDLSPDFGSSFSDFYDSSIYWTDYNIGRIMSSLAELGIADDTVVVIVSDHGEAFFEHGIEGHARNLYREVLDTPWIIALPFELDEGVVVHERVANVDVWPTLLDLMGQPPLPGAEGESVLGLVVDAAEGRGSMSGESERAVFAQLDRSWGRVAADSYPTLSMVKGPHRINYPEKSPDRIELFDRSVDPKESRNIAAENPELVEALREDIDAFLAKPRSQWSEAPEVEVDEMHMNQLRALGYVLEGPVKPDGRKVKAMKNRRGAAGVPESEAAAPEE